MRRRRADLAPGLDLDHPDPAGLAGRRPVRRVSGQQPGQGGEHGTVSPVQPRTGDLPTRHRHLVAKHEDLRILSRITPCQENQPAEHHPDRGTGAPGCTFDSAARVKPGNARRRGPSAAVRGKPTVHRPSWRHGRRPLYVRGHRNVSIHGDASRDTRRDKKKTALAARFRSQGAVFAGGGRCWVRTNGRLSRRFHRPLSFRPSYMPLTSIYAL